MDPEKRRTLLSLNQKALERFTPCLNEQAKTTLIKALNSLAGNPPVPPTMKAMTRWILALLDSNVPLLMQRGWAIWNSYSVTLDGRAQAQMGFQCVRQTSRRDRSLALQFANLLHQRNLGSEGEWRTCLTDFLHPPLPQAALLYKICGWIRWQQECHPNGAVAYSDTVQQKMDHLLRSSNPAEALLLLSVASDTLKEMPAPTLRLAQAFRDCAQRPAEARSIMRTELSPWALEETETARLLFSCLTLYWTIPLRDEISALYKKTVSSFENDAHAELFIQQGVRDGFLTEAEGSTLWQSRESAKKPRRFEELLKSCTVSNYAENLKELLGIVDLKNGDQTRKLVELLGSLLPRLGAGDPSALVELFPLLPPLHDS